MSGVWFGRSVSKGKVRGIVKERTLAGVGRALVGQSGGGMRGYTPAREAQEGFTSRRRKGTAGGGGFVGGMDLAAWSERGR